MKIRDDKISIAELKEMGASRFGNLVRAVVDVKKEIMAVDAELHTDEESALLERGSSQRDLLGRQHLPGYVRTDSIELDSLINLRPSQGNRSRGIDNPSVQVKILRIVDKLAER